jgi:hypothetical protein
MSPAGREGPAPGKFPIGCNLNRRSPARIDAARHRFDKSRQISGAAAHAGAAQMSSIVKRLA